MRQKPITFYPARVSGSGSEIMVTVPDIGSDCCASLDAAEDTARHLIAQHTGKSPDAFGVAVVRSMAVKEFAKEQASGVKDQHVAPLNDFVEQLRLQKPELNVPWVAPFYRGAESRVLVLLRDPGPMADSGKGSGFLCAQNNDKSAENQSVLLARAGIDTREVLPWNSYPWYVNRAASGKAELADGVAALRRFLDLLPRLEIVMLAGVQARESWRLLEKLHRDYLERRGFSVVWTYHPSGQALWHRDPTVREWRRDHQLWTAIQINELLKAGNGSRAGCYVRTVEPPPNLASLGRLRSPKEQGCGNQATVRGARAEGSAASTTRARGIAALRHEVVARGGSCDEILVGRRSEMRIKSPTGSVVNSRVSTRSRGTWQTNMQYGDDTAEDDPNRVWIFVDLESSTPGFFIMPEACMQRDIADVHSRYLAEHGGTRPKSDASNTHHAVRLDRVEKWRDRWDLLGLSVS